MPRPRRLADTRQDAGPTRSPVVVLYDDRPHALIGLKLAALSLAATSPGIEIRAIVPRASDGFRVWAASHGISVSDVPNSLRATGWDVKPTLLLHMLDTGAEEVLWFDTDIIASQSIRPLLAPHSMETLVATEEYYWGYHQGSSLRTTTLGLEVGRVLPRALNSGVLRVSAYHRSLLEEWAAVLATPEYVAAQGLPVPQRSIAYLGDQDVLCGLLGSRRYADVPITQLRRGVDIAQCFGPSGFTVKERWVARHRLPPLVHAMGRKPWSRPCGRPGAVRGRLGAAWENVHLDLTPYIEVARPYLPELAEPADWIGPITGVGRALSRIGPVSLRELPLTVIDTTQRGLRRGLGIRQVPA